MPWSEYTTHASSLLNLSSQDINGVKRQDLSYMVNEVPSEWMYNDLDNFVGRVLLGAGWIFVTDSSLGSNATIDQGWGSNWDWFTGIMWHHPPRTS